MGLLTYAYAPGRGDLQRASDQFRLFREQPTPQLARMARAGLTSALSPNERLQTLYHPWASYVVVPLFALANVGIVIDGDLLARAVISPVTLGVVVAYVVGKPAGIVGTSWLVARLSGNRFRPPVGWVAVVGVGTISGIGFTVALLIATHAPSSGPALDEAKFGILVGDAGRVGRHLAGVPLGRAAARRRRRARALLGVAEGIVDLMLPVDPERDHMRGSLDAPVTVVEYGDFECPYCGQAEPVVRELLADFADVRYVWRHLPLTDVHPHAQLAAEAAEAAGEQGAFWEMHDLLLAHQDALNPDDLLGYAEQLGLDLDAVPGAHGEADGRRPGRRGRRLRRPQRRHRHPDLLHQRPAAPRRVRHRGALGGGEGGVREREAPPRVPPSGPRAAGRAGRRADRAGAVVAARWSTGTAAAPAVRSAAASRGAEVLVGSFGAESLATSPTGRRCRLRASSREGGSGRHSA